MNKRANSDMMVGITIVVIMAMIVISIVFGLIRDQTITTTITDDQFTASNETCTQITSKCIVSFSKVENSTAKDSTGNFSICEVGGDANGLILGSKASAFGDKQNNGKTLNATYTERSCSYIGGFTQTIINYLPILLAVVLLVFVAGFMVVRG